MTFPDITTAAPAEPDHDRELETPADPIAELFDDLGLAKPGTVPADHPILTGGAQAPCVPRLIGVLNDELGLSLPIGEIVTSEVLQAARALRSKHSVPEEQGLYPADNYIGPNTWAAVEKLAA